MKIVLIGAGSFVFAPTVLRDIIERHRMVECAICLVDLNTDSAQLMAMLGNRMAADLNVPCTITVHSDRCEALEDTDFVILSACPQGQYRWKIDCKVLEKAGLPDQRRECGGLGGLSNALRNITLALDVAHDMEKLCPNATLMTVTNPMPKVVTAINRFTSIRSFGFCNVAHGGPTGYEWIGSLLKRPHSQLNVVTGGLNHFAWLLSVHDAETGSDLLADVLDSVNSQSGPEMDVLREWLDKYGALAVCGVHHQGEYMPPDPRIRYTGASPHHGTADERDLRRRQLLAVGSGQKDWGAIVATATGSWEHPVNPIDAIGNKNDLYIPIVNLPNDGCLVDLPAGRIVEAPANVRDGHVQGQQVGKLPSGIAALCQQLSDVHELVSQGAATGSHSKLVEAIGCDIAIPDKKQAMIALDRLLEAHRDILPQFHE